MTAWRDISGLQLFACACITLWATGLLALQQYMGEWNPPYLSGGIETFWKIQATLYVLWIPYQADQQTQPNLTMDILAAALLPFPLLLLASFIGITTLLNALLPQAILLAAALLLGYYFYLIHKQIRPGWFKDLIVFLTQIFCFYAILKLFPMIDFARGVAL